MKLERSSPVFYVSCANMGEWWTANVVLWPDQDGKPLQVTACGANQARATAFALREAADVLLRDNPREVWP